jgi:lactate dehydrogenase-like 2-hydroxyacid dehydrogenase
MGTKLASKRCGIVALRTIGRAVAQGGRAFDMSIGYFRPRKKDDRPYTYSSDLGQLATME